MVIANKKRAVFIASKMYLLFNFIFLNYPFIITSVEGQVTHIQATLDNLTFICSRSLDVRMLIGRLYRSGSRRFSSLLESDRQAIM